MRIQGRNLKIDPRLDFHATDADIVHQSIEKLRELASRGDPAASSREARGGPLGSKPPPLGAQVDPGRHGRGQRQDPRVLRQKRPLRHLAEAPERAKPGDFLGSSGFQSERFTVLVDEDDSGAIRGIATLTHRPGYLHGGEREIMYLGDFRVAFDRQAMKNWRKFYSLILESNDIPTITCVIDENLRAQNALVRDRPKSGFR